MELEVDIRQYVIMALGANEFIHKDIDEIYNENKVAYYKAYKESNYYESRLFKTFTTLREEHMKKVAGIVQFGYATDSHHTIYKLIKKGYKFVWNFVQQRRVVSAQELAESYAKRKGFENVLELEILNVGIIAMYLCLKENKTFNTKNHIGETIGVFFEDTMRNVYVNELNFTEKEYEKNLDEINELRKKFLIPKKTNELSLEIIFEKIIQKEMSDLSRRKTFYDEQSIRHAVFKEGVSSYIGALSGWLKVLHLHESDIIASSVLSNEDIDKVFLEYIIAKRENNISESDQHLFIISTFYMKAIADEYKRTKEIYLADITEEFYYELNEVKEEIEKQKELLKHREQSLLFEQKRIENERTILSQQLDKVSKEKDYYKSQIEEKEDNRKELLALRELMFVLQTDSSQIEVEDDKFKQQTEFLQQQKCVIIGGHPGWVNKMKDLFPSYVYINPDNKGLDLSFLDNTEQHVVYNTATNNHSFYNKVMNRMSKNETPLHYINSNHNIEITVDILYKALHVSHE